MVAEDPAGPIPAPSLPPGLEAAAREAAASGLDKDFADGALTKGFPEDSTDAVAELPAAPEESSKAGETAKAPEIEKGAKPSRLSYSLTVLSPEAPELVGAFTGACLLEQLAGTPPATITGLDQRMRADLETAKDVLHAYGYYEGSARGKIRRVRREKNRRAGEGEKSEPSRNAYMVTITFSPGPQYTVGPSPITPTDPQLLEPYTQRGSEQAEKAEPEFQNRKVGEKRLARRSPPASLAEAGLPEGAPAHAGNVLDAASSARELFRDRGYPFAKIASARYFLDGGARTLHGEVAMDSGPLVYMGPLLIKGESNVKPRYLEALQTWREGRAWSQRQIENFRDSLRQSGLFVAAEIYPADEDGPDGLRPVVAELTPAPERTVGGAVKYDTDFGLGVQGYWEHRNLTGRGDHLRFEAPVWMDLQEVVGTYRLPFFVRNDQDLIARSAFRHENTDAYELTSATGSVGVERRLSRRWKGSLSVMGEGGELKDPNEPRRSYYMGGFPGTLSYDGTNSLLDATRGVRLLLAAGPYAGEYNKNFSVVRVRSEGQAFVPVVGKDDLVMAFRGMYGMVSESADKLPASIRYYVGGGGSVRGYDYQSLGPRNDSRDPLGGASAVELGAEARMKFDETWGLVMFIDGGMAYNDQAPDFSEEELRWGAGLGVRLYTAIGPVRFDVATPLNPRKKDSSWQMYFSIGQSF